MIFSVVVEPTWTDADVDLPREPLLSITMPPLSLGVVLLSLRVIAPPIGLSSPASFVAYPANGRHRATEDHDVLVVSAEHLRCFLIAVVAVWVDATGRVGTSIPSGTSVGAVKPVFEELTIACR